MENNNLIKAIIGATVTIVIIGSLLMPVISDLTKTSETLDNSNFARYDMKELESGDAWTLSGYDWSYDSEFLTTATNDGYFLVLTDTFVIEERGTIRGAYNYNSVSSVTVDSDTALTVNSASVPYTKGYGAVQSGDLILKDMGSEAFVKKDTDLWTTGAIYLSSSVSSLIFVEVSGNVEDGFTATATAGNGSTVTDISAEVDSVDAVAVDGYKDVYAITSVTVTISGTYDETSVSTEASFTQFVMPKTITAELSDHMGAAEISIMYAIPIVLIVSILMGFVGVIIMKRDN